jgi:UDPglucose--hexose-1-phosphate uridylyltransferase
VLALPRNGREPNTPGWRVRVVPNLYPAFDRQEVVIHSPRHVRRFAELDDEEVEAVAAAWSARAADTAGDPASYVFPMVNEGRAAGASLPHSHSQLVWFPEAPPAVRTERAEGLVELLRAAREERLDVLRAHDLVAFCHPAGRLPYEVTITSEAAREARPDERTLSLALLLLRDVLAKLGRAVGDVPWNAWLHHGREWHIELVPRLAVIAGLELGAGVFVNAVDPAEAALALRDA